MNKNILYFFICFVVLFSACAASGAAAASTPGTQMTTVSVVSSPAPQTLSAPVITFQATSMTLGSNAFDQWGCQKVSQDGTRCLDGKNSPVTYSYKSIYGEPNPTFYISSRDLGEGAFEVTVNRQSFMADYGQCIVATAKYQEIWFTGQGQLYNSTAQFTICLSKEGIWYFNQHL